MWKHSLAERWLLLCHRRAAPVILALLSALCLALPGLMPVGFCLAVWLAVCLACQYGPGKEPHGWRFLPSWRQVMSEVEGAIIDERLLLTDRPVVVSACMPMEQERRLALHANGSGLLLATAAALTITCLGEDAAPVAAALAPLGFSADKLRGRWQVLGRAEDASLRGILVRDGRVARAFYVGDAGEIARRCTRIFTGSERPLGEEERLRLLAEAQAMRRPDPHDAGLHALAYAMASWADGRPGELVYLGKLCLQRVYDRAGLDNLNRLLDAGLPVCLLRGDGRVQSSPDDGRLMDHCPKESAWLHIAYDSDEAAPAFPLKQLPDAPGDRAFADALLDFRQQWRYRQHALALITAALIFPALACGLLSASAWPMLLALLPGLVPAALLFIHGGSRTPATRRVPVLASLAFTPAAGLLAGYLGGLNGSMAGIAAGCVYAICLAALVSLALTRRVLGEKGLPALGVIGLAGVAGVAAVMLLCGLPVLPGLFGLALGGLHGLITRCAM